MQCRNVTSSKGNLIATLSSDGKTWTRQVVGKIYRFGRDWWAEIQGKTTSHPTKEHALDCAKYRCVSPRSWC
jgi:hypothetical protein